MYLMQSKKNEIYNYLGSYSNNILDDLSVAFCFFCNRFSWNLLKDYKIHHEMSFVDEAIIKLALEKLFALVSDQ